MRRPDRLRGMDSSVLVDLSAHGAGHESSRTQTDTVKHLSLCQQAILQLETYRGSSFDSSCKAAGQQRYYRWRIRILGIDQHGFGLNARFTHMAHVRLFASILVWAYVGDIKGEIDREIMR